MVRARGPLRLLQVQGLCSLGVQVRERCASRFSTAGAIVDASVPRKVVVGLTPVVHRRGWWLNSRRRRAIAPQLAAASTLMDGAVHVVARIIIIIIIDTIARFVASSSAFFRSSRPLEHVTS